MRKYKNVNEYKTLRKHVKHVVFLNPLCPKWGIWAVGPKAMIWDAAQTSKSSFVYFTACFRIFISFNTLLVFSKNL